jgi:hypothetical protein
MYFSGKPDQPVVNPGSSTRPRPISPHKPPEEQERVPYRLVRHSGNAASRDRPVTPEVAGSSPVAPVF